MGHQGLTLNMNILAETYGRYFKNVKAQYAPFGYGDNWSNESNNSGVGISGNANQPLGNLDLDMAERVQPYSRHQMDSDQEWGTHKGDKANGSDFVKVKKLCPICHGKKKVTKKVEGDGEGEIDHVVKKKCKRCHGKGYIIKKKRYSVTNPEIEGRVKQQGRYNGDNQAYWPHNRDVYRLPSEQPTSWEEYSQKPMLGKGHN